MIYWRITFYVTKGTFYLLKNFFEASCLIERYGKDGKINGRYKTIELHTVVLSPIGPFSYNVLTWWFI